MKLKRLVGVAFAAVLGLTFACGSGCSSSADTSSVDSGTAAGGSSQGHKGSSSTDVAVRRGSSAESHDAASESTAKSHDAARDSAHAKRDSSSSADVETTCSPQGTWSFGGLTYVPAVGHQGVCTKAQIAAFVKACGRLGTEATCTAWLAAQVKPDAAGTCGDCVVSPHNNGAVWFDPAGVMSANYAGCIQLTDSTNGAACAAAYDDAAGCDGVACDMACREASDPDAWSSCTDSANAKGTGSCAAWVTAETTACAPDVADGGALTTCFPSSASGNVNSDLTYIATLICGQ